MAIKRLIAISYCLIFIAIYLFTISYAFMTKGINKITQQETMPIVSNATMGITSFFPNMSGGGWILAVIVLIIVIVISIVGSRTMAAGI